MTVSCSCLQRVLASTSAADHLVSLGAEVYDEYVDSFRNEIRSGEVTPVRPRVLHPSCCRSNEKPVKRGRRRDMTKPVREQARDIPVLAEVDVLIAGVHSQLQS